MLSYDKLRHMSQGGGLTAPTATVIIKTKQINHQYGYVCGIKQLHCELKTSNIFLGASNMRS